MDPEGGRSGEGPAPDLLQLAGSVPTPAETEGLSWDDVRARVRDERATRDA